MITDIHLYNTLEVMVIWYTCGIIGTILCMLFGKRILLKVEPDKNVKREIEKTRVNKDVKRAFFLSLSGPLIILALGFLVLVCIPFNKISNAELVNDLKDEIKRKNEEICKLEGYQSYLMSTSMKKDKEIKSRSEDLKVLTRRLERQKRKTQEMYRNYTELKDAFKGAHIKSKKVISRIATKFKGA